ncbi:ethanolamine ammonia-lyase subunit EutC [Edaphobacter aggregans]|uniref:ethanolamine ammonia-lyase subunit EutC n=1 Tax=Edaphobacter aggregans TaxID=570835 RepID=UPI00055170C9|nr:ethanolamine ammonia-lyase subunit EutC [Edaphobacter aggregans]
MTLAAPDPWQALTRWTSARIALGRAGASAPTRVNLDFQRDHALARDAIHAALDVDGLEARLRQAGFGVIRAWSMARERREYLCRPDLGRSIAPECVEGLRRAEQAERQLTVVMADGLSSIAAETNAVALLDDLRAGLEGWVLDDVVIATQARVALGDGIGELRGAEAVLMLIGERPGLSSHDSLGAYLTYRPRVGRTDAERNCVSNIRPGGLGADEAASRLVRLLNGARALKASGVALKDTFGMDSLAASQRSFPV